MSKTLKDLVILASISLGISLLIWLPFVFKLDNLNGLNFSQGFPAIYRNFDGLEYVVIAKTFYNPGELTKIPQSFPAIYYASHFPGYPILIATFAPILGYLKSMLFVSTIFTIFGALAFYFFVRDFKLTNHPLWLSILFLVLPARWIIVHSVGSPEPIFIFSTILSFYFFKKFEQIKKARYIWLSAIFVSLTTLTRPPGILIFVAIGLYLLIEISKSHQIKKEIVRRIFSCLPLLLAPLTVLLVFYWFNLSLGDFWAYFHTGDNIHLAFPPFQVFNKHQLWVGDIWLEDIIYIFILGFLGGLQLLKTGVSSAGVFVLTYLAATIMVAHRDIARYSLPIVPFVLVAFERVLTGREFKIVVAILALAFYLYSLNFISENTAPVNNLSYFN